MQSRILNLLRASSMRRIRMQAKQHIAQKRGFADSPKKPDFKTRLEEYVMKNQFVRDGIFYGTVATLFGAGVFLGKSSVDEVETQLKAAEAEGYRDGYNSQKPPSIP